MISERQIPQYLETMRTYEGGTGLPSSNFARDGLLASSSLDGKPGFLISHSRKPLFSEVEVDAIVQEAENRALQMGWTTQRHANYPTTDVPLVELPQTLGWFKTSLVTVIYPFLTESFDFCLPDPQHLKVVDAFVVKYNATAGQSYLKEHRDGSVLSFNIALNSWDEYEGGGTYFRSQGAVRSNKGHVLAHASGLLHGGHPITAGVRYILVAFVILQNYPNFASRFYEHVRNQ